MKIFYGKNIGSPDDIKIIGVKNIKLKSAEKVFKIPAELEFGKLYVTSVLKTEDRVFINFVITLRACQENVTVKFALPEDSCLDYDEGTSHVAGEDIELTEKVQISLPNGTKVWADQISFKNGLITTARVAEDVFYLEEKKSLFGKKEMQKRIQIYKGALLQLDAPLFWD